MIKKLISREWYFSENGKDFSSVDLPHDYAIKKQRDAGVSGGNRNGFYPDSEGTYIKYLTLDKNTHYILDIDGAYMNTQVLFNENHVAYHPYGYSPLLCDVTPFVMDGCTNKLKITLSPLPNSTRWYSGNGIFRDVFLWEGGDIRIEPWDMFISTVSVSDNSARLRLRFWVNADKSACINVRFSFIAPDGSVFKTEELSLEAKAGERVENEYFTDVDAPLLWDTEAPNLYTLKTDIYDGERLCDTSVNTFGIRVLTADAKNGLLLNGKPIKLRGGCIHHDHGALGAAAYPDAEERKLTILKRSGFNAIRCAHNPPSTALLECCDRMGIIVMDEAYEAWNRGKTINSYHCFFADWGVRDLEYMVRRDRQHPCVISYSIGNEILEIDGTAGGAELAKMLAAEVRRHDDTRFVTAGLNKAFVRRNKPDDIDPDDYKAFMSERFNEVRDPYKINEITAPMETPLDICGFNYYYKFYEVEHECYPDRVMWGSETKVIHFYESWKLTAENPYIIGDFTWTAYDNIGEVGAGRFVWGREGSMKGLSLADYPWRTCYQSDHDLCGYRRPQSYYREAVWLGGTEPRIFVTHPEHFGEDFSGTDWHWYDVDETWSFDRRYEGKPITVETYTDADEIRWFVNGEEVGRSVPERAIARIDTVYRRGSVTAKAFKNGVEVSSYTLESAGEPCAINVRADREEFAADGRSLCYFEISITDREGRLVCVSGDELRCAVEGGELLGIYSGDPCNEDSYGTDTCHAFKGRALAVVSTKAKGTVRCTVTCGGLAVGVDSAKAK